MAEQRGGDLQEAGTSADLSWTAPGRRHVLAHREICRSSPLEVITENLSSLFYPARVACLTRNVDLGTSILSGVRLENVTVGLVHFGTEVVVDPGALGAYHVNVPLSGWVASECGPRSGVATVERAAVFTPPGAHRPASLEFGRRTDLHQDLEVRHRGRARGAARAPRCERHPLRSRSGPHDACRGELARCAPPPAGRGRPA